MSGAVAKNVNNVVVMDRKVEMLSDQAVVMEALQAALAPPATVEASTEEGGRGP